MFSPYSIIILRPHLMNSQNPLRSQSRNVNELGREPAIIGASDPSDLGLKPFGGDWAEWETQTGTSK